MAIVQLPFVFAAAALATAVARRLGAGRASWFAGALVLSCPIVVFQAGLAYADVISLAALAASLMLLFDAVDGAGFAALTRALAAGACLGLSLGAKYAAIPLIATGLPVLVVYALRERSGRLRIRNAAHALALAAMFVVGLVPPAWFWYLRNLRLTDNPIFPIGVPALGVRGLFLSDAFNRGKELELVGSHVEWLGYPFTGGLSHESGFGAAFAALVPIALVLLVIALSRNLLRRRAPRFALLLAWGVFYLASWWVATPHEARHLLPLVLLLGAPATLLLRGSAATPTGLRLVACTALLLSTIVLVRIQLFVPTPDLSVRRVSWNALYDLPEEVLASLPRTASIANLAGRPYNFALIGPTQALPLYDFAPGIPEQAALRYRGATHVFMRGAQATVEDSLRRVQGSGPPLRLVWQTMARSRANFRFWGATDTDVIALYELAHEVGDGADTR
jgi:4-amino-4-deoxy-L-arabinose transferase-like glycosyltransferase